MINLPQTIKLIITDFDGIITDNCVYIDENGKMSRKINFKDIMGFSILHKSGYKICIISGEKNKAIDIIAKKFDVENYQNIRTKIDIVKKVLEKYELTDEEWIYIGDDINDYDSLCRAKYAITVPGAVKKIKEIQNIQITENHAGDGAFREIADALIEI